MNSHTDIKKNNSGKLIINPTENYSNNSVERFILNNLIEHMRTHDLLTLKKGEGSIILKEDLYNGLHTSQNDTSIIIKIPDSKEVKIEYELTHDLMRTTHSENERYEFRMGNNFEFGDEIPTNPSKEYVLVKEFENTRWRLFHTNYQKKIEELAIKEGDELDDILKYKNTLNDINENDKIRIAKATVGKREFKDNIYVMSKIGDYLPRDKDGKVFIYDKMPALEDISQHKDKCLFVKVSSEFPPWKLFYVNSREEVTELPLPEIRVRAKLLHKFANKRKIRKKSKKNLFDEVSTISELELFISRIEKSNLLIGAGNYAKVYRIEGKINSSLKFKPKKLVMNVEGNIKFHNKEEKEAADQESEILQVVRFLHAKPTYFRNDTLYKAMKYLEGQPLSTILSGENKLPIESKQRISARKKIQIGLAILHSQKYLHHLNILHGDIKPDNLILSSKSKYHPIKPIDYNIAQSLKNIDPGKRGGTIPYAAPELLQPKKPSPMSKKSDLHSIGITLMNLFNVKSIFDREDLSTQNFNDLDGLGDREVMKLMTQFQKMISRSPKERGTINDAIKTFEEIDLALLLEEKGITDKNSARYQSIVQSYRLASQIRKKLYQINSASEILPLFETNKNFKFDDETFTVFKEILGIKNLDKCKNYNDILTKVKHITDSFSKDFKELNEIVNETRKIILLGKHSISQTTENINQLHQAVDLYYDAAKLLDKHRRYTGSLDDMNKFDMRIKRDLEHLKKAAENLNLLTQTIENNKEIKIFFVNLNLSEDSTPLNLSLNNLVTDYLIHSNHPFDETNELSNSFKSILFLLNEDPNNNEELNPLKNKLKLAIVEYMNAHFSKNMNNKTRAASKPRLDDIKALLTIINQANSQDELLNTIKPRIQQIHGGISHVLSLIGLENLYTGSELKRKLIKVIMEHDNKHKDEEIIIPSENHSKKNLS